VLRAINPRHNPTQDTRNCLLKPFRLRLSLARSQQTTAESCVMARLNDLGGTFASRGGWGSSRTFLTAAIVMS
jgi:hypothetical protein